jgi:hypothetical protein
MDKTRRFRQRVGNIGPTYGPQALVQATEIAISIYTDVQAEFEKVLYPEMEWPKVVDKSQRIGNINLGAQQWAYLIKDWRGAAAFESTLGGRNVPRVNISLGLGWVPLGVSSVSALISDEDARQYQMGFKANLAADLADVMQLACENHVEATVNFGDPAVGFRAFLSYAGVILMTAASNGQTPSSTKWSAKTGIQMVYDVNAALSYVYINSRTIFVPHTIVLPPYQLQLLATTYFGVAGVTAISALEYLRKNNASTAITGKELEIISNRYLKGAGASGVDRMVVMARDKKNQCMPLVIPYRVKPPIPTALGAQFVAEQKFGSFAIKQPMSMVYVDGI